MTDPIEVEPTEVLPAATTEKQMKWDVHNRDVIMLRQISFSGTKAWLTLHANVKGSAEHQYNRKEEWKTILALVKTSEAFKNFAWPNDEQAIIQWVERQIKKYKHLWTQGMEQNEPAEAGTEGTKCEAALTELQQLLMEIDEHKTEAERITAENKAGKDKASELSGAVGKAMQDQLVGKKYGTDGERLPAAAGSKKRRASGGGGKDLVPITIAAYAESKGVCPNELAEEFELDSSKVPKGYKYVDPSADGSGSDTLFATPYLMPVEVEPAPRMSATKNIKAQMGDFLKERTAQKGESLKLEREREEARAKERAEELEIEKAKAEAQQAAAAAQQAAAAAQQKSADSMAMQSQQMMQLMMQQMAQQNQMIQAMMKQKE